jgi:hypothetical protein
MTIIYMYRYGQLSGMVEPLAGLFGAAAVVVRLLLNLHDILHVCVCAVVQ